MDLDTPDERVPPTSMLSPSWWTTPAIHPTLQHLLNRRTRGPVDLFSFYIYMRDQQRSVDYLDFWYVSVLAQSCMLTRKGSMLPST
jgi:hypothetical protein